MVAGVDGKELVMLEVDAVSITMTELVEEVMAIEELVFEVGRMFEELLLDDETIFQGVVAEDVDVED